MRAFAVFLLMLAGAGSVLAQPVGIGDSYGLSAKQRTQTANPHRLAGLADQIGPVIDTTNCTVGQPFTYQGPDNPVGCSFVLPSMGNGRAPSIIYILTSNVVASTTTDTNCLPPASGVGAFPASGVMMPANVPYAGNTFRLICRGVYSTGLANVSGAAIKVKVGLTVIASASTLGFPSSISNYQFLVDVICTVKTIGASGSITCNGNATFWTAANALGNAPMAVSLNSSANPVAINTSVDNNFLITSALTSVVGSPSITATSSSVEILY